MTLQELIKAQPDRLGAGFDAAGAEALATKLKEAGITLLANDDKAPAYVPKSRMDEVIAQKAATGDQLNAMKGELETMQKAAKGNAELETQLAKMQGDIEASRLRMREISIEAAIRVAASGLKAHSADDVLPFVDRAKIAASDDGTVDAGSVQAIVAGLKEQKPYLFAGDEPAKPGGSRSVNAGQMAQAPGATNYDAVAKDAAGKRDVDGLVAARIAQAGLG